MAKTPRKGTPENPNPRNAGRDPIEFDYDQIRKLARFMFTDEELAVALGCTRKTIQRRRQDDPEFVQAIQEGHADGKKSLRAAQLSAAMKGNTTMLVWLGKQYLGQKETITNEHTGANGGAIDITTAKATLLSRVIRKPS